MNRRKKIFDKIVNPLLVKYLTDPHGPEVSIAKKIPMKYLPYFKEITGSGNGMKVRYRFRGTTGINMNAVGGYYKRPQSFCHLEGAKTFSVYER